MITIPNTLTFLSCYTCSNIYMILIYLLMSLRFKFKNMTLISEFRQRVVIKHIIVCKYLGSIFASSISFLILVISKYFV